MKKKFSIKLNSLRSKWIKLFSMSLMVLLMIFCISVKVGALSSENINYFGTVVPCGKDNGYKPNTKSNWNPWSLLTMPGTVMGLIPDDDPHKGWSLGSFFVEGYSAMTDSNLNSYKENMPVYLKNTGDTVSFGFKLDQNINKLNGKSSLKIADDHKVVKDCWVEDPYVKGDFHHGVLIIVHTDYQGKQKISTYRDFLKGVSVGANTEVQLFEEGDYRVILCYEIYKDTSWNWITDWMDPNGSWFAYRMESYFSVRNGNSMVYLFDSSKKSELTNRSYTETGFIVDLAKSRYLQLSVKKENLNKAGTDIIEDVRFNKVIADGTEFTSEGKYTITVKNVYTNLVTEKIIYVGTNDVMRCNTVTGLSISEINEKLISGYTINSDGTLREPQKLSNANSTVVLPNNELDEVIRKDTNVWKVISIITIAIIVVGSGILIIKKKA